jgi:2-amino-4-hydroxy-6-hydroxymethyldihydropteridine diphosphokinase
VPTTVYLSLGSNLGDRASNLRSAIDHLGAVGKVAAISSLYETEPVEVTDQPWFINCAVALETDLAPQELLAGLLAIERQMGRHRDRKKGPRLIDLDVLLYEACEVHENDLTIPHPAMHERRFVLEPLAEIAPEVVHPMLKKTIRELRDALNGQTVRKLRAKRQKLEAGS